MSELLVVLPERSEDFVSDGLRQLTAVLERVTDEDPGFGLGGEHGYGVNFENDVFVMRRFYWGDCDCGFTDAEDEFSASFGHKNVPWEKFTEQGHKPTCSFELPNFQHKASGFSVKWYKWIGRDNEIDGDPFTFPAILAECVRSITRG